MPESTWQQCVHFLQDELPSQQFNTWIRPLRAEMGSNGLRLLAPNRFVKDWVNDKFIERIHELVSDLVPDQAINVSLEIGGSTPPLNKPPVVASNPAPQAASSPPVMRRKVEVEGGIQHQSSLIDNYTFDTFVEGKSNQLARAAARQVAEKPGRCL